MTHPPETRQEAVERLTRGESQRDVAKALGVGVGTVNEWSKLVRELIPEQKPSVRERFGTDLQIGAAKAATKLLTLIASANDPMYMRDVAYAMKCLSDASLDWLDGRKSAATVNVDNSQHLSLPPGLSLDELRAIARE